MLKLLLYAAAAVGIGAFGLYSSHRITQARSEKQNEKQKRALFDAAIRREDFVQFRELLQRFIRLDPRDDRGNTPFMLACQHGNLEVIRYYLSMHPPSSDIQKSPLFLAANDNGHTAVHVAALSGSMETMRALLGSNSLLALAMVSVPSIGSRQTPLHLAVDNGLFPMVEALIKLRADVNAADTNGITPLMIAVKHGRIAFVERLLTVNADTNLLDKWKHSALFYACKHQEYDIARMLLEKKKAAGMMSPKITPRKTRPSPMSRSPSSSTAPPTSSSSSGSNSGDILNVADRFGYTPLLLATELGDLRMFNLLLEYGAEVTRSTKTGRSAIHLATRAGAADLVSRILELPLIDIQLSDARGATALHDAASLHRLDILSCFRNHSSATPVTFSLIDNHGRTPLHVACIYDRPAYTPQPGIKTPPTVSKDEEILDLVRALVQWGSPTDVIDANGESAVDLARRHGLESVVAFLLVHNAGRIEEGETLDAVKTVGRRESVPPLQVSLSNLRIPLEIRVAALHGNVSLEGIAAVLEEGAWRVKNNFDRANPFSVVVVVGPRAASSVVLKDLNPLMGVEPLREDILQKNPKEFFRILKRSYLPLRKTKLASTPVHNLLLQLESLGILRRVITLNVDAMDSSAIGLSNCIELRGSVRPPHAPISSSSSFGSSSNLSTSVISTHTRIPRCHRCREPFGDPEVYWNLVESADVVMCKRKGCVSGYVTPGIAFDDSEKDLMGQAFWDVVDEDLPACGMIIFIGASMDPNSAMEVVVDSIPPHVPRLLIDTQLSGPFTSKTLPMPLSTNPNASDATKSIETIADPTAEPDRKAIEKGSNYRDVAVVFSEEEGGISRGVKELARCARWGWDWDMKTDAGIRLKSE